MEWQWLTLQGDAKSRVEKVFGTDRIYVPQVRILFGSILSLAKTIFNSFHSRIEYVFYSVCHLLNVSDIRRCLQQLATKESSATSQETMIFRQHIFDANGKFNYHSFTKSIIDFCQNIICCYFCQHMVARFLYFHVNNCIIEFRSNLCVHFCCFL